MAKREYMWGAWVVWKDGRAGWAWDASHTPMARVPYSFCERRKDLMPMALAWRKHFSVKSCTPVKVPIPAGPADE